MPRFRRFLEFLAVAGGILVLFGPSGRSQAGAQDHFIRGDANADGRSDLSDAVYMLGCAFLGTECPACADASDVNDDGKRDIADPVYLLGSLFLGGASPPPPGEACGADPTADELDCGSFTPCAAPDPDSVPTPRGDLMITPLEHATLALRWDRKTVYVDPVGGAARFAGLPAPDVIVVTHTHGDHLDPATIRAVAGRETVLAVPRAVSDAILRAGGVGGLEERVLSAGEKTVVGDIEVQAVPMYNLTAGRLQYHARGQGNGYVIDFAGTRVYVSGDTEDIPEMRGLEGIALAFICMNLPFTMTPEQAASAALEFLPRVVYPYHYRGQDPLRFKSLVEAETDGIEVRIRDWYPAS